MGVEVERDDEPPGMPRPGGKTAAPSALKYALLNPSYQINTNTGKVGSLMVAAKCSAVTSKR